MENLSEELLAEILGRIADKDAVRCKIVCKSWHLIISKEYFMLRFWPNSPIAGFYIRTLKPAYQGPFNWTFDRWEYINHLIRSADFHDTNFVSFGTGLSQHWNRQLYDDDDFLLLDCCNGLQLLFNSSLFQYIVYNPTTKQQSYIPKARAHLKKSHFLAALAFDPTESLHYRVVRLSDPQPISNYKLDRNNMGPNIARDVRPMINNLDHIGPNASVVLDLFCSETGRWVRYLLQLGNVFTSTSIMFWRHFTYLRGVLYWMVSSSKILCIDLNNVVPQTQTHIDLPNRKIDINLHTNDGRLNTDRSDMCPVGCFGVSMNHLYYCRRESDAFCVWFYNDDGGGGGSSGEWVVKFRVSIRRVVIFLRVRLRCLFTNILWIEPIALGPNADVLFIGTNDSILSYHFETKKLQFVYGTQPQVWDSDTAVATCFFPFFLLRTCLVQFCKLDDDEVTTASINKASEAGEILSLDTASINSEEVQ